VKPIVLALAAALLLSGCTTRIGDLTVGSTKNLASDFDERKKNVEGDDCMHMVLFIPLGTLNPTYDAAIDKALEPVPDADALADAVFHQDTIFTLLYNRSCIRVKGTAIKTKK
jgi:hypothetical protein